MSVEDKAKLIELRRLTDAPLRLCIEALKKFSGDLKACERWLGRDRRV